VWTGLAILGILTVSGGTVWYLESQPYHFLVVTPGKLYRSGTLDPRDLERVIDRYGLKTVVSLRTPGENRIGHWYIQETAVCRRKGVDLVEIPIAEPPSEDHITRWLDLLRDERRLPVLVHCKHGSVRTGIMVAIYDMELLGKDNRAAIEELGLFGHDLNDPWLSGVKEFLESYIPRWKRPPARPLDGGIQLRWRRGHRRSGRDVPPRRTGPLCLKRRPPANRNRPPQGPAGESGGEGQPGPPGGPPRWNRLS